MTRPEGSCAMSLTARGCGRQMGVHAGGQSPEVEGQRGGGTKSECGQAKWGDEVWRAGITPCTWTLQGRHGVESKSHKGGR